VWGLFHEDGWALLCDSDKRVIVPFWPEQEFASLCCSEQWVAYKPKMIPLSDFKNKWLPGMQKENRLVNVFYTTATKMGSIVKPDIVLKDLEQEIQNYL
jgi:hypothetical protein